MRLPKPIARIFPGTGLSARNALENRQMADIDAQITGHLTTAARLRAQKVAEYGARIALENEQMQEEEIAQLYTKHFSPILAMVDVFRRLGIPGVEIEVLREVEVSDKSSKPKKPRSNAANDMPTITLPEYTGKQGYSKQYQVIERVNGWLIPGDVRPERKEGVSYRDWEDLSLFFDNEEVCGISPWTSLLLTEDGRDWAWTLTPAGIDDGTVKGVLLNHVKGFSKSFTKSSAMSEIYRDRDIEILGKRLATMVSMAEQYGFAPDAPRAILASPQQG